MSGYGYPSGYPYGYVPGCGYSSLHDSTPSRPGMSGSLLNAGMYPPTAGYPSESARRPSTAYDPTRNRSPSMAYGILPDRRPSYFDRAQPNRDPYGYTPQAAPRLPSVCSERSSGARYTDYQSDRSSVPYSGSYGGSSYPSTRPTTATGHSGYSGYSEYSGSGSGYGTIPSSSASSSRWGSSRASTSGNTNYSDLGSDLYSERSSAGPSPLVGSSKWLEREEERRYERDHPSCRHHSSSSPRSSRR